MTDTPSTPPEGDPTAATPGAYGARDSAYAGDAYPAPETVVEPKRGPGRGVLIGAGAAVLAVIAGAAVYATTALSGGGRQPDELAPRSTFAYAKIDLDPAANQKLAAREFFGKFPKVKKPGNDENIFDALLRQMFEEEEHIKYDTDIKPWFDKRAAIAGFRAADGPTAVGIIQSKDDAKARAAMDKIVAEAKKEGDDFAYKIDDGYVVVGDTQAHVDDAIAQAGKESIEKNDTYTSDIDRLDGDQVVVAWADLKAGFDAVKAEFPQAGLIPNSVTDQLQGRIVAGLHLDGDYVEVSGLAVGGKQPTPAPVSNDPTLLKNLPKETVAAVSVNGLGEQLKQGLAQLGAAGMDPTEFVGPMLQELGLDLEADVLPLLGDPTVVTLGNVPLGFGDLSAGILSTVKDPAAAKEDGAKLADALTQMGFTAESDVAGNTFYLATGDYLATLKAGNGGLGTTEKFTKAMGDSGSVVAAFYLDLEAVVAEVADAGEEADVKALKSLGVTAGYEGGAQFFRMRVVAL